MLSASFLQASKDSMFSDLEIPVKYFFMNVAEEDQNAVVFL